MRREIQVFGTKEISKANPINSARDMTSWLIANINIVRTMYDLWSTKDIDDNTFDLAMIEGLEKIEILALEIQEALDMNRSQTQVGKLPRVEPEAS